MRGLREQGRILICEGQAGPLLTRAVIFAIINYEANKIKVLG